MQPNIHTLVKLAKRYKIYYLFLGCPVVGEVAEEEGEGGYKKKPRIAPTEQDHNERILLPIKSTQIVLYRRNNKYH